MSAPRTNVGKQAKHHVGPLVGMALVVLFGVGIIVYWLFDEVGSANNPQNTAPAEQTGSVGPADEGSLPSSADGLAPPAAEAPQPLPAPATP